MKLQYTNYNYNNLKHPLKKKLKYINNKIYYQTKKSTNQSITLDPVKFESMTSKV